MNPLFFNNTNELNRWLQKNHQKEAELWLGYYKKKSDKYNFSWSDSVDELLCFGWIDGLRKSIDDERYMIRITPRKPKSNWSKVNLDKVDRLIKEGRMKDMGLKAYEYYDPNNANQYSFEKRIVELRNDYIEQFQQDKKAWEFFQLSSPTTKKQSISWVMSAKREDTRIKRLNQLIACSRDTKKIPHLEWTKKKP